MTVAGPLESPEARQALCYAFPYDEVIEGIYKGYGKRAVGPVAEVCRGFAPGPSSIKLTSRKRDLLAQAGVAEGTELTLMMDAGDAADASTVQLFQANLAEIGITLSVETVTFSTLHRGPVSGCGAGRAAEPDAVGMVAGVQRRLEHLQAQVLCSAQGSAGTNAGY